MRSAIVAAAFAAGALAVPIMERDVVYETHIEYATAFVTVTQGEAAAPTYAAPVEDVPAPVETTAAVKQYNNAHWGHANRKSKAWSSSWATTWTYNNQAAAPEPTQAAPEPEQEEQAPAYTSEAPAPSSYEAPAETYDEPTSAEPAPSPSAASSASGAAPSDYKSRTLHHHNIHRANHTAPDLTWSESLAATAEKIGQTCSYEHNTEMDGGGYGQNIAAGVKADNVSAVITELFYNGEVGLFEGQYGKDAPDMSNFHEWGHFTQIVWKGTTEVGCATVDCSSSGLANTGGNVPPFFTVCNYKTPGNFANEYASNVLESRGDKTCYWDDAE